MNEWAEDKLAAEEIHINFVFATENNEWLPQTRQYMTQPRYISQIWN
jgi:hypothetical protein